MSATTLERRLLWIWRRHLGGQLSVSDDFFDAGGRSLTAVLIANDLADELNLRVSVSTILRYPSVAALADALSDGLQSDGLVEIDAGGRTMGPLTHGQEQMWWSEKRLGCNGFFTQLIDLELNGPVRAPAIAQALGWVAGRHGALRTRFDVAGGLPVQHIDRSIRIAFDESDLSGLIPSEREAQMTELAHRARHRTFSLHCDSGFAAHLIGLEPERWRLLLSVHHAIFDGWSRDVLVSDLTIAYAKAAYGELDPPVSPPTDFIDFASWQRESVDSGALDGQIGYWREHLHPLPDMGAFATGAEDPYTALTLRGRLDPAATEAARDRAAAERTTLFVVLLAAYGRALRNVLGLGAVAVATLTANRGRPGTSQLVGLFVNTLILILPDSGAEDLGSEINAVHQVVVDAYANEDVPFEVLLDRLADSPDAVRRSLLRLGFALHSRHSGPREAAGVQIGVRDRSGDQDHAEIDPSTFAITLELREVEDYLSVKVQYKAASLRSEDADRLVEAMRHQLMDTRWSDRG